MTLERLGDVPTQSVGTMALDGLHRNENRLPPYGSHALRGNATATLQRPETILMKNYLKKYV